VIVGDEDLHPASIVHRVNGSEPAGEPTSYLTLEEGTKVVSSDGEQVGTVEHVLADEEEDIFDGIVIESGGHHLFAEAALVDEMRAREVCLKLDAAACHKLPEPSENPAVMETGPDDTVEEGAGEELRDKLRRAWDRITGNY
jgi:hypothetical protein